MKTLAKLAKTSNFQVKPAEFNHVNTLTPWYFLGLYMDYSFDVILKVREKKMLRKWHYIRLYTFDSNCTLNFDHCFLWIFNFWVCQNFWFFDHIFWLTEPIVFWSFLYQNIWTNLYINFWHTGYLYLSSTFALNSSSTCKSDAWTFPIMCLSQLA